MTYATITIARKPVTLDEMVDEAHAAETRREERLALAAPTLYNALTRLVQECVGGRAEEKTIEAAKAALAAAQ